MDIFLRFMGWLILYSLFYFISLDITLNPPGTEDSAFLKIFNYGILLVISIPLWWITWKKFESAFSPKMETRPDNKKTYTFALRNPALMYYLMILKLFLLVMGLNGVLTLSQHKEGMRIFYIINFIILYIYAIPFFLIKFKKLKKALKSRLIVDDQSLTLETDGSPSIEISVSKIDEIILDSNGPSMLVKAGSDNIYVGGRNSKASGFFVEGAAEICEQFKNTAQTKIKNVDSIKAALKTEGIKPAV